jgi:predicted PurR-regulated permease PerM
MRYPTRFQQKTLWNAITGVSLLTIGALICGGIWLVGEIFSFLQVVLIPLVVAGIVAYLLDPVVRLLENRGLTRLWAVVTVFFILLIAIVLLGVAVMPGIHKGRSALRGILDGPPVSQVEGADATAASAGDTSHLVPALAKALRELRERHRGDPIGWALAEVEASGATAVPEGPPPPEEDGLAFIGRTRAGRMITQNMDGILTTGREWVTAGSTKVIGFLALALGMIMVPVYLFFFLKDSAAIRLHWHDYVPLRASRFKTELISTLQEINGYLISFFRGQVLVAAIDGILVGIALEIYGLPYGFLIGVFMAILGVVPYIGNILCLIPACIIGFLHAQEAAPFGLSPWAYVGGILAIFVIVQQINSLVTAPKIVGDSVGLHPLTVIFSMLFWSIILGGFVGALLAVPLTAAVKVLFRRYIWERQLREDTEIA